MADPSSTIPVPNMTPTEATSSGHGPEGGVSMLAILNAVLRHRMLLIVVPILFGALGYAMGRVRREYVAESRLIPDSPSPVSGVASLAAQFGLGSAVGAGDTPEFYMTLLKSRELLRAAAQTKYSFALEQDTLEGTLLDLYRIRGKTSEDRLKGAVSTLDRANTLSLNTRSGVITMQTSARWLPLSEQLNRRLLQLVNEFNLERRQSRAAAERKFVEGRTQQAQTDLQAAEAELRDFLERNRSYQNSPRLVQETATLQRKVDLHQSLYVTLAQSYEKARIDEVRNTPVVTVIDGPEGSAKATASSTRRALLGLLLGLAVGFALAFGGELGAREREEHPGDFEEFVRLTGWWGRKLRRSSRPLQARP